MSQREPDNRLIRPANRNPFILRLLGGGKSYFVKTPGWLKKLYSSRRWHIDTKEKKIYLSFDDGPHPLVTPFVLDELKKYDAKASFFCIGKNVSEWPELYKRIIAEGHRAGNHTYDHLNGFTTPDETYLANIRQAAGLIDSTLFRPPYGRLRSSQARQLAHYSIIMWDILSGDFDESVSKEKCLERVLKKTGPGSIVVFHDSGKAWPRLEYALPRVLEHFSRLGYDFLAIPSN